MKGGMASSRQWFVEKVRQLGEALARVAPERQGAVFDEREPPRCPQRDEREGGHTGVPPDKRGLEP